MPGHEQVPTRRRSIAGGVVIGVGSEGLIGEMSDDSDDNCTTSPPCPPFKSSNYHSYTEHFIGGYGLPMTRLFSCYLASEITFSMLKGSVFMLSHRLGAEESLKLHNPADREKRTRIQVVLTAQLTSFSLMAAQEATQAQEALGLY